MLLASTGLTVSDSNKKTVRTGETLCGLFFLAQFFKQPFVVDRRGFFPGDLLAEFGDSGFV